MEKENESDVHPVALQGQHSESDLKNAGSLREDQLDRTTVKRLRPVYAMQEHPQADFVTPSIALLVFSWVILTRPAVLLALI